MGAGALGSNQVSGCVTLSKTSDLSDSQFPYSQMELGVPALSISQA